MAAPFARLTMESKAIPSGGGVADALLMHPAALDNEQREFDSLNRFSKRLRSSSTAVIASKEDSMPEQTSHINISFTEDAHRTRADATLALAGQEFHGFGQAKRAPGDPSVPMIGEELAAARALSDLFHQLIEAAPDRIGSFEGRPVNLHG
jgi:uncharacterized protein DUF1876